MNGEVILSALPATQPALPCQVSSQLFFAEREADVDAAKALCNDCPIRTACLLGAIERHEPWGVWGGEVFVEGVIVAHKRGRGRPRKHPLGAPRPRRTAAAQAAAA